MDPRYFISGCIGAALCAIGMIGLSRWTGEAPDGRPPRAASPVAAAKSGGTAAGKPQPGEGGRHATKRLILEAGLDDHDGYLGTVPAGSILEVDLPVHEDRPFRWQPARCFGDRWEVLGPPGGEPRIWRPENWVPGDRSYQSFRVILRQGYGTVKFYGDGGGASRSWSLRFTGD